MRCLMTRQHRWQQINRFKGRCVRCARPVAIKANGLRAKLCPIHLEYVAAAVRQHRLRAA
jgi:hypothetical protein